jgi:predicted RNase H-like HicB family nuclease
LEGWSGHDFGEARGRFGTRNIHQYPEASAVEEMNVHRFLIVIENAGNNYSAYSPDLPGCVATGETREETEQNMYEAIQLHLDLNRSARECSR